MAKAKTPANPALRVDRYADRARLLMQLYGETLHAHRKAAELTLRGLGDEVGIPASDLTRIENARMIPTTKQQESLRLWLLKHRLYEPQKEDDPA